MTNLHRKRSLPKSSLKTDERLSSSCFLCAFSRAAITALLVFSVFLIPLGCDSATGGIFYHLENETETLDGSLDNNLSVTHIIKSGGTLYFSAGRVYEYTGDEWKDIDPPTKISGENATLLSSGVASLGDTLYASFYNEDGTKSGVYTYDSNSWNEISITGTNIDAESKIITINSVNGNITVHYSYLNSEDNRVFSAVYTSDGSSFYDVTLSSSNPIALGAPINDFAYHDSNYWLSAGNMLYKGTYLENFSQDTTISTTADIEALYADSDLSVLFAADSNGYVHTNDGSSWNKSNQVKSNDVGVNFSSAISFTGNNDNSLVCFGSKQQGYFEMSVSSSTDFTEAASITPKEPEIEELTSSSENYKSTDLYNSGVKSFYYEDGILYLGTASAGLWKNTISNRKWSRE